MNKKYSKWMFITFPAIAMMLGWGLRGHIGGHSFGAMIPGVMVVLSLCLLLELPSKITSIIVAFGMVGIGMGGEMTYGQTLGFLRDTDTIWWGTLGTTLKGSIWGMLGGAILAMGFIYKRLTKKTVVIALLLMMFGILLGFKLINQPMVIYFSDPVKPRPESWAALLFGAVALLLYLKFKLCKSNFKIISRFTAWGLIGGALGFGLGGFWMVLGSQLPTDIIFHSWWKAMEFTFGLLFGAALGNATWISRKELKSINETSTESSNYQLKYLYKELGITLIVALLVFWIIPQTLEPFSEVSNSNNGFLASALKDIANILVFYSFSGFILIVVVMNFPKTAWQLAITITFCYTAIDFGQDNILKYAIDSPEILYLAFILTTTLMVALLTAYFQRKKAVVKSMLLLLIWSTLTISFIWLGSNFEKLNFENKSICNIICGSLIVDIIFAVSGICLTWIVLRRIQLPLRNKL